MRFALFLALFSFLGLGLQATTLSFDAAWLTAVFVTTILLIIAKPFPMGTITIASLSVTVLMGWLPLAEALRGFSSPVVWLVLSAFFISKGMTVTGLGQRIGLIFIYYFGQTPLRLAYAITLAEILIAPTIPSVTARSAGVIYPIVTNLSRSLGSEPDQGHSAKKIGEFLTLVAFQSTVVTSAMYLTAMAANPLLATVTNQLLGQELVTFSSWLQAAILPGLVSCFLIPLVCAYLAPPSLEDVQGAKEFALSQLKDMGRIKFAEVLMLLVMCLLLVGWIFGSMLAIDPVTVALVGLSILLLCRVLSWNDILEEKTAWDTFLWFAILLMFAGSLKDREVINIAAQYLINLSSSLPITASVTLLLLSYFYSHYFFAMTTAHVSAMFLPFATAVYLLSSSSMSILWLMIFMSSLFGGLTHYSIGPAPILFATGYVSLRTWWKVGFIVSVINLLVWSIIGHYWWSFLGFVSYH